MAEEDFIRLLRRRDCVGLVAETNDHIAGYLLYERNKGCIDLLSLAVDPKSRRAGVGTELIAKLIAKLSHSRHPVLAVSVRDSNLSAHLFFRSLRFRCVQVRHHSTTIRPTTPTILCMTFGGKNPSAPAWERTA